MMDWKVGIILCFVCVPLLRCSRTTSNEAQLFEQLDSSSTNINFINSLAKRKGKFSVVDYLYYYNGAGVASGDINNDGLTDIFFVSNEHENKLYLNQGNFKFKDISKAAGIIGYADWKTGVTMADVNGDGFLDIYICAVSNYMGLEGSNELYINNGDETFTESSSQYGLDFSGFSSQAAFFDFDRDGDLDLYLVNHAKFVSRSSTHVLASVLPENEAIDYLFRNDNSKFIDISKASGIHDVLRGYGLGVAIADINSDGWEDVYVTNDFYEDDYYFINNQDGTFREEGKNHFGHFSLFSRGCDIADMNNDGYEDVMTVDVHSEDEAIEKTSFQSDMWDTYLFKLSLGYHYQFSRNSLQINNPIQKFSDVSFLSGVATTDCSWATLLADYDNDGYKDIFISNGVAARLNDLDYLKFAYEDSMKYWPKLTERQIDLALKRMPEGKYHNYLFRGNKELMFEDKSSAWGMTMPNISTGSAYADLDNDGDLDLITNNINEPAGVYKNKSNEILKNNFLSVRLKGPDKNTFGIGTKIYVKTKDGFQLQHIAANRGYLSSVEPIANFGIGSNSVVDSLIIVWNDQKVQILTAVGANKRLLIDYQDAKNYDLHLSLYSNEKTLLKDITTKVSIPFVHKENKYSEFYREKLIPFLVSTEGPKISIGDVNNDGLEDVYAGGAKYQAGTLYLQQDNGSFKISTQSDFMKDSTYEDVDAAFFDIDQDKDLDLYVASGGNEFYGKMDKQFDRIYRNDGSGNFIRDSRALPPMYDNKSCVRPFDFDNDGDLDVFVGGRVVGFNYGKSPQSYLLMNDGNGNFSDVTKLKCPGLINAGMITDACWVNIDKDGDSDLIVSGDWMPIKIFENSSGTFEQLGNIVHPESTIKDIHGLWQCLVADDFDHDGDMDFMAGNLGENTSLRKNGSHSEVHMFIGDFDLNKQNDQIVSYNRSDGKFYPAASKVEWETQFPSMQERIKSNSEFAGKSIDDLFEVMNWSMPEPLVVNQFASLYFQNTGNNNFIISRLPTEVQGSKVFSLCRDDINQDGNMDVLVGGNTNSSGTYQGIYDANQGCALQGDGKGNFNVIPVQKSGFSLDGQVRDIKSIKTKNGTIYIIAKNGAAIQVFQKSN